MPRTRKAAKPENATIENNQPVQVETMSETNTLPVIDGDIVTTTEETISQTKPEVLIFSPSEVEINSRNARTSYISVATLIAQITGAKGVNLPLLVFQDVHNNGNWTALDGNRRLLATRIIEARKTMTSDELNASIEEWEGVAEDSGLSRYDGLRKAAPDYDYKGVNTQLMAIAIPEDKMEDEGYQSQVMYLSGIAQERLKPSERALPEMNLIKAYGSPGAAARMVGGQRSHFSRVHNVYTKKRNESLVRAVDDGWLNVEVADILISSADKKLNKMEVDELLPKAIAYALDNGVRTISRPLMLKLVQELEAELNPPDDNGGDGDGEGEGNDKDTTPPRSWGEIRALFNDAAQMLLETYNATSDDNDQPKGDRLEAYNKLAAQCDKLITFKLKADKASNEVKGEAVEGEAVEGEAVQGEAVEGETVEGEAVQGDDGNYELTPAQAEEATPTIY